MQTKAIRIHEYGGPEQMRWEEIELAPPGSGEVRIRHQAVGLNYIDIYHRSGIYPTPPLPCILGMEAAGTVEAVGSEVRDSPFDSENSTGPFIRPGTFQQHAGTRQ